MSTGFAPPRLQPAVRPTTLAAAALSQSLKDCFALIKDPRVERTRLHQLADILTLANKSGVGRGQRLGRYGNLWGE